MSLLLIIFIIFKRHFLDEVSIQIINRYHRIPTKPSIRIMTIRLADW